MIFDWWYKYRHALELDRQRQQWDAYAAAWHIEHKEAYGEAFEKVVRVLHEMVFGVP